MRWMMTLVFVSTLLISNVVGEIDMWQVKTEVEMELPELSYDVNVNCMQHFIPTDNGSVRGYLITVNIYDTSLANDPTRANSIVDMLVESGVRVASRYPEETFWILGYITDEDPSADSPSFSAEEFVGI